MFVASATLWFEEEEDLDNVANIVKILDGYKISKNSSFNFNEYLSENRIEEEGQNEYLASVLIFESSRAANMHVDENSFSELNNFYEKSERLSRDSENLILTNDTGNVMVLYVYVNRYSQSITVSCYATTL